MADILTGNTASMPLSNIGGIKIKLIDDESLLYQFINMGEAYEPVTAEIVYAENVDAEDDDEDNFAPCFYVGETQFFLSEFIRDGYPEFV